MLLKDYPLTDPADQFMLENTRKMWSELVRHGRAENGIVRHGITIEGGLFPVQTTGEEEYVLYTVFIQKIRRDNHGLEEAPVASKRAWYEMAKQFVKEFGEDRTPPDVIDCMGGCKDYLDSL